MHLFTALRRLIFPEENCVWGGLFSVIRSVYIATYLHPDCGTHLFQAYCLDLLGSNSVSFDASVRQCSGAT